MRAGEKKHLKMFPRPVPPPDCCQFGQWEVEALLDSELAIDLHWQLMTPNKASDRGAIVTACVSPVAQALI